MEPQNLAQVEVEDTATPREAALRCLVCGSPMPIPEAGACDRCYQYARDWQTRERRTRTCCELIDGSTTGPALQRAQAWAARAVMCDQEDGWSWTDEIAAREHSALAFAEAGDLELGAYQWELFLDLKDRLYRKEGLPYYRKVHPVLSIFPGYFLAYLESTRSTSPARRTP